MLPWRKRQDLNLHAACDASLASNEVRYRSAHSSELLWQWERGSDPRILSQDGHGLANRHITALSSHCIGRQGGARTHRPLILSPRGMPIPVTCPHFNLVPGEGFEPTLFCS